ncbi:MAG: PEFG-CTERM sorting domain-containing protein, partial [Thaumarchaeota archaeon]|nr:PEFG-CTERM sorting domain-containing protein [Nitrososphaerota archaeon]
RTSGTAQIGGYFEKFTFTEDQTGPMIIKFENIRNTGQETEFTIVVVPEFGTITLIILVTSIAAMIFVTKRNSFRFSI